MKEHELEAPLTAEEIDILDQVASGKVRRGALAVVREVQRARARRTKALREARAKALVCQDQDP